jgi:hypothetical protein
MWPLLALLFVGPIFVARLSHGSNAVSASSDLSPVQRNGVNATQAREIESGPPNASVKVKTPDHYLMLVNTARSSEITADELKQFDRSSYDGLAVVFAHVYESSPPPSIAEMDAKIAEWKKATRKDMWPWVYLNRMIGVDEGQHDPHTVGNAYFHRIKGADLEDKAGAQGDFLKAWGNSLRAAKDSQVPGIVCDLEFYNYYKEYNPTELARQTGKTPQEVIGLLKQVGAHMADVAAQQYPDAMLWFFFTGLGDPGYTVDNQRYLMSTAYIVLGLLDEIQQKHFRLRVLSGGEVSLGYCHPSLQQFQNQIRQRAASFAPHLQRYAGILELGGTMTLWSESGAKTGWLKEGDCGVSSARNVEELQPSLELLLRSYKYNWIYGSTDGGYYAFHPAIAPRFDAMINKAKASVAGVSTQ